jgi:hypothetical protein
LKREKSGHRKKSHRNPKRADRKTPVPKNNSCKYSFQTLKYGVTFVTTQKFPQLIVSLLPKNKRENEREMKALKNSKTP